MTFLSAVYGQVTQWRRHWYEQKPQRQRRLGCPVISVGNLAVGGSGKTPVVELLAALLRTAGHSPAILSRGYRRRRGDAIVVVSDGRTLRADVGTSGDEPQLLARRLPDVPVIVGADRFRAGTVACRQLGADVLILDDGFQHVRLARTLDLLLLSPDDLTSPVLPAGRLREPLAAARGADAILAFATPDAALAMARQLGVPRAFAVQTAYEVPKLVTPYGAPIAAPPRRVVAVAAIARPERFVAAVRAHGYEVAAELLFRDHHWFTPSDVDRMVRTARERGADAIITTEKDAVRLEPLRPAGVPTMYLPLHVRVEPADRFRDWVLACVRGTEAPQ